MSCFEKLQTTLRVKGFNPHTPEQERDLCFPGGLNAVILLYIQHSDSKDINFLLALAMAKVSVTDNWSLTVLPNSCWAAMIFTGSVRSLTA